jgi:hypothetical protein
VKNRGHVTEDDLQKVLAAGYSKAQALEVVLGVGFSRTSRTTSRNARSMNLFERTRGRRLMSKDRRLRASRLAARISSFQT